MSGVLQSGALLCTTLGLLSAFAVGLRSRDVRLATGVLLEFLLAAGLLRLADDPTPQALVTAALVVLLRRLLSLGMRAGAARPLRADRASSATLPPSPGSSQGHEPVDSP